MILIKPSYEILTNINEDLILKNIERAGRVCYKSEDKITNDSAKKFVDNIINSGHHSVIEHEHISVKFCCDRGVSHEIVRHRLASYSQESTRYCNYKGGVTFVIPPWVEVEPGEYRSMYSLNEGANCWLQSMLEAEVNYKFLLKEGWTPQQARTVLPNSLKTEIVMTANIREWIHVLRLRCSKQAHPQIRELMVPLKKELETRLPTFFMED